MKSVIISVKGKVQGVFFRASAKHKAKELSLAGWCKNEADGSVLINIEGKELDINNFINWCSLGPELSKVEEVIVKLTSAPQGFEDFKIRR
uniref:acylphosphatase n=1 Tax=Roseivirga sp. TaxID=1964215 RepID=UPI0040470CC3